MDYLQIAKDIGLPAIPRVSYAADTSDFRAAGLTESKIGGAPYRPQGAGWPLGSDGQPLCFIAQVNLEQVEKDRVSAGAPPLLDGHLPTSGLIQFFLPFDDMHGLDHDPTCFVCYLPDTSFEPDDPVFCYLPEIREPAKWAFENPNPEYQEDKRRLKTSEFDTAECPLRHPEVPFALEPKVWEPVCHFPTPGWQIESTEEHNRAWQERVTGSNEWHQTLLGEARHQVGGVANFTQDDPRPEGSPLRLLFQLDGDDDVVELGDAGTMQFFIAPADLARGDFSKVLMNWACY